MLLQRATVGEDGSLYSGALQTAVDLGDVFPTPQAFNIQRRGRARTRTVGGRCCVLDAGDAGFLCAVRPRAAIAW